MECPNCQSTISDDSIFCTECGTNVREGSIPAGKTVCRFCGAFTPSNSNYCVNCRAPLTETAVLDTTQKSELQKQEMQMKMQLANLKMQQEQLSLQNQQLQIQTAQYGAMLKCPKCGSTSISGNQKGYGIVKGGLGALALGAFTGGIGTVVGLGAGNIGRKKVQCTCMQCGHKFKAGKR